MASTPFIMFLDSDVELPNDWIEKALNHMYNDQSLAAVGGQIIYAFDQSHLNAYGGDIGIFGLAWDINEGMPIDVVKQAEDRIWINCSAMLAKKVACQEVGGFDEQFFYGYEDSDIGWKFNIIGYRLRVFPNLKAYHHVEQQPGATHSTIVFHYCKNRLRSVIKNASAINLVYMLFLYLSYSCVDLVLNTHRISKIKALGWNLKFLKETISLRKKIQSKRCIDDKVIFKRGACRWFPLTRLRGERRRSDYLEHKKDISNFTKRSRKDDRI